MKEMLQCLGILAGGIGAVFLLAALTIQVNYWCASMLDRSEGTVHCDFEEVYEGRLYRVEYSVATENLQSPMFKVLIRSKGNYFKVEKRLFCQDFRISGK